MQLHKNPSPAPKLQNLVNILFHQNSEFNVNDAKFISDFIFCVLLVSSHEVLQQRLSITSISILLPVYFRVLNNNKIFKIQKSTYAYMIHLNLYIHI